jgi:hypothetical protein
VQGTTFDDRTPRGVRQMIGLLDYSSGRVAWDIRRAAA